MGRAPRLTPRILLVLIAALLSQGAHAEDPQMATAKKKPAPSPSATELPRFEVQEATLKNGLRIRLLPNPGAPVVSYYTFFRVGSRNERPGITGISHLFEHMMFNGAKKYGPKAFDRTLESHGGYSNAYTSNDLTVYYEDFASEALEKVIDLESDRMRSLTINDKSLASEREVVKEERRVRVDNEIAGLLDEELSSLVYKAHPYHWPVIGWMRDLDAISREDCQEYFRTYYAPNNAIIYVVGDIDPGKTLALIKRYYGNIKAGPPVPEVVDAEPEQRGERRALVHHPAQAPSFMIGYHGPDAKHPDTLVLDVIQYALTIGEGSRLVKDLVYDSQLAAAIGMDWSWRIDPGMIMLHAELKPGADPAAAERAIYGHLERIAREGLTERELEKVKNNLYAHILRGLVTNNGRANTLGNYELTLGSWQAYLDLPARYQAITQEQIKAAAAKYFAPTYRSVVTLVPTAAPEGAGPEAQAVH